MDSEDIMRSKEVKYKNKEILLEVALSLNKKLFDENKISYKMFKYTEENILKELKICNVSGANAISWKYVIMSLERRRRVGFIYCSKAVKYGNATYKYKT